jgi:hypothetical protein
MASNWGEGVGITQNGDFYTDCCSGPFVCYGECCLHLSIARFCHDGNKNLFCNTYCRGHAEISCSATSLLCWMPHRGSSTSDLFTALNKINAKFKWANIYEIFTIRASWASLNFCRTAAYRSKKFNLNSLPSTYVQTISHYALLLCGMRVLDRSSNDPVAAAHCRCKVREASK